MGSVVRAYLQLCLSSKHMITALSGRICGPDTDPVPAGRLLVRESIRSTAPRGPGLGFPWQVERSSFKLIDGR